MKILVTGGAGFIGSNFVRMVARDHPQHEVVGLDSLTYAGNLENLKELEGHPRFTFVKGDIADGELVAGVLAGGVEAVVNFAAESHVDRSIEDPGGFLQTNVIGTGVLLEAARRNKKLRRFLQVSTDEVYGSLGPQGRFSETSPLAPSSPYSASKTAADLLALSYHRTYQLPVIITRSSNNYGPYQFPEKLIPLFVTNALQDQPLPLYGRGANVRDWIHVEDNCRAILQVLERGRVGEVYNIGGNNERNNLEITGRILKILGKPESLIKPVKDRPGHDFRYALDSAKLESELGFACQVAFEQGLKDTVKWYRKNTKWWQRIKSGEYLEYYEKMYGKRLGKK
jgi:dTDP-glucose 4,6-dehydratase